MRADLNKQLCERERRGSRMSYKAVRRSKKHTTMGVEGESLPASEGMTARYGYNTKDFSENLNPLYSQLRKAVGRPWAKFYSELCQNFDKRSVINQHILQHLYDRLEIHVHIRDGELWCAPRYGLNRPLKNQYNIEYYVDPRDGIIKKNRAYRTGRALDQERKVRLAKEELEKTRWIDEDNVLRKIGDVWFHFTMQDTTPASYTYTKPHDKDIFLVGWRHVERTWDELTPKFRERFGVKRLVGKSHMDLFTGEHVSRAQQPPVLRYHATKKTASHKVLKSAGIIN